MRRQIGRFIEAGLAVRGGRTVDVEVVSHALLPVLEHFGRMLLEDPDRFERDRLVASVWGLLMGLDRR